MNRLQLIVSLLLTITAPFLVMGQEGRPLRIEIEAKALVDDYYVIPTAEYGMLLLFDDEDQGGKDAWSITYYNKELKELWQHTIQFDLPMRLLDQGHFGNKQITLFVSRANRSNKACLLMVDLESDSMKKTFIELPQNFNPEYFLVSQDQSYLLGNYLASKTFGKMVKNPNFHHTLLLIDHASFATEEVELKGVEKMTLLSAMLSGYDSRLEILLQPRNSKKSDKLDLLELNSNGILSRTTQINAHKGKIFSDAKITQSLAEETVVVGTYSSLKGGSSSTADGMFMAMVGGKGVEFLRFHPFMDFKTCGYIVPANTYRKAMKKRSKGQEASVGIQLLFNDEVLQLDSAFIVRAEAYHPEYRTEFRYDPFYGYSHTVQVFEGWRYDQALVAGFNAEGDLLWDQSLRMGNILQPKGNPRAHVQLLGDGENLIIVYTTDGDLYSIVLNQGEVVESRTKTEIETGARGDIVKANFRSDMTFWYDGYILVWGYQRIRTDGRKREVFFFNKIAYR